MAQRGPLVTAVVVVGGLVGLMTANAAGGLVAAGPSPTPSPAGATQTETPPPPPANNGVPAPTTTAPPPVETSDVPTTKAPPPGPAFPAEAVYAGKTVDSPLYIAVAVKGTDASAYLCDGAAVESWLKGSAENGTMELSSKDGANTLTGRLDADNALKGALMIGGVPHEFSIVVAPPPAGLYRGENGETTTGWIILPSGKQVGITRTGNREAAAPALDPAKGGATVGGKFVPAQKVTGETSFG
ncbi:hypothetical protein [Actinophytocola oryzae]|uniref:Serine/threonine protein kinase n=1 Tax=Actinophytocola oryzae TaxID=502181 RepID=A0A4R7VZB4_9PSEU|nr:hypothetical protein [Actinophytocola oryzae]TDV55412.1 hypothetical protein CLV71_103653 [Actinophytocola oryzae]